MQARLGPRRSLLNRPGDQIEQLDLGPDTENIFAVIAATLVSRDTRHKPIQQAVSSFDVERELRLVDMKDSKLQWGPHAKHIAPEPDADLENEATVRLFPPTVAGVTFEPKCGAELFEEWNHVLLPLQPVLGVDAQPFGFHRPRMVKECAPVLHELPILPDLLVMFEQAFEKRWRPVWRLNGTSRGEEFIQKRRAILRLNSEMPHIGMALSYGQHGLQSDFVPVSVEQLRLMLSAKPNDLVLPNMVNGEAKSLECALRWTSAGPFRHPPKKRMVFRQLCFTCRHAEPPLAPYAGSLTASGAALPRIISDALSAIISVDALRLAEIIRGMIEASTTRRP